MRKLHRQTHTCSIHNPSGNNEEKEMSGLTWLQGCNRFRFLLLLLFFLSRSYRYKSLKKRIEKERKESNAARWKERKKGGREKMSFRNTRNDVSKVPGWLLCICSVWERKCVATSLLMLLFYFWSKEEKKSRNRK